MLVVVRHLLLPLMWFDGSAPCVIPVCCTCGGPHDLLHRMPLPLDVRLWTVCVCLQSVRPSGSREQRL